LEVDSIFNPALFFDWRLLAGIGLTVAALSFLCWFSFVRHLTGSIRQLEAATERIAEGRFDVVAAVNRGDELGHLSAQINRMASRLAALVNGQKRFLGDIAHELCAPIARMQLAMSILDQRADERGRESLADLREEVDHISDLVNELLQFSKAALRPEAVKVESLDVAAVVARVISREAAPETRVHVSVTPGLRVLANETYFARSLGNLLRNSVRYAGDSGPVEIGARPDEDQVVITVADQGPGVAEHELERILEPFYRRDESRSRNTGGAGLGLAIVKAGIESCHGSVKCRNRQPHGLEVTIRLPAPGRA
jgi:two-component system, OmpR family, sensor histidine kinase CpxA